jgi:hypothetical protein
LYHKLVLLVAPNLPSFACCWDSHNKQEIKAYKKNVEPWI